MGEKNILLAKSAGFCFGVQRAIDTVYGQLEQHGAQKSRLPIYTFGPIIHNEEVVKDLEERVMRMRCCASCGPSKPALPDFIGGAYASSVAMAAGGGGCDAAAAGEVRGGGVRGIYMGGRRWLGEGGAGSGSSSGGVPRPDSAAAAGRSPAGKGGGGLGLAWPG